MVATRAPSPYLVMMRFIGETRVYAIGLVNGVEITVIYADKPHNEKQ